jgi:hypothetical protein
MFVRSPYNYDPDSASAASGLVCEDEHLTKQEFKDDCDLNVMIRKFGINIVQTPDWAEFDATVIPKNYHELMQQMVEAKEAFESLPSEVRNAHGNDPVRFNAWVESEQARIADQRKAEKKAQKAVAQSSVDPAPSAVDADKPDE